MQTAGEYDIRSTIRGPLPRIPFAAMKEAVLGKEYSLSLVICGDTLAQKLNRTYRNKEYKPNVLSFPLDRGSGEIFLNIRKAAREAEEYGMTPRQRTALLFIHSCLHLKGYDHGAAMERQERKFMKQFGFVDF